MDNIDRRKFLASSLALAAAATLPKRSASGAAAPLRVQFTAGGHTVALPFCAMFEDPLFADMEVVTFSHPNAFQALNGLPGKPGPDVLVLYDWIGAGWSEPDRAAMLKFLDAGKGLISIHHAMDDNARTWPWWQENVIGVNQSVSGVEGMKTQARLKVFFVQTLTPVGNHPIVRDLHPFRLPWDEVFPNMGFSPKITPLLNSDDPDRRVPTCAWLGIHPKAKVVVFEPGHSPFATASHYYRKFIRNSVLWAGGRLS